MIVVHRSNSLQPLFDELALEIAHRPPDPLRPETIVVDSVLHGRWLSEQLARRFGVWANPHFPFLRAFLDELGTNLLGAAPTLRYGPVELPWHIARALVALLDDPAFADVRAYLGEPRDDQRMIDLCRELARTIDRYLLHRPRWVLDWERGIDLDHWQARLVQRLTAELGPHHLPARLAQLVNRLDHADAKQILPERIHLFGPSHLPPPVIALFAALGQHTHVHLYAITPSRQFLGNIARTDRDVPRVLGGSLRRFADMQQLLEGLGNYAETDRDLFVEPVGETLLRRVQRDLLHATTTPSSTPPAADGVDRSLAIHLCHSPLREVEVAVDRLLAAFTELPSLRTDEVALVTPDLDTYAPLCAAVLAEAKLPFRIAGRSAHRRSAMQSAFLQLLDLASGRVRLDDLLVLFDAEPVRRRLELDDTDRATLERWFRETHVRWGIDAAHRERLASRRGDPGTFRFALDRLLAGYLSAMPLQGIAPLPLADLSIGIGPLLGRLHEFLSKLFVFAETSTTPRTPVVWLELLADLAHDLLAELPEEPGAKLALVESLRSLAGTLRTIAPPLVVPASGVRSLIQSITEPPVTRGVPDTGTILVTDLASLGALPRRVIVGIGFVDGRFPRGEPHAPFDRMSQQPMRGDPNRRDDDRARFLQLLLAPSDRLELTYAGRSQYDDNQFPPSVLIEELYESFAPRTADEAKRVLLVEHPLQPFSPRAFDATADSRQQSFLGAFFPETRDDVAPTRPFYERPLPASPATTALELTIDEWVDFLHQPLETFCRRHLGLNLRASHAARDREPIGLWLDGLQGWTLEDELLDELLRGRSLEAATAALHKSGLLTDDALGRSELRRRTDGVLAVANAVLRAQAGAFPHRHAVELVRRDVRGVIAVIDQLATWETAAQPLAIVRHRAGGARSKDLLQLWLRHVAYHADPARPRLQSRLLTVRQHVGFAPVDADAARAHLDDLLAVASTALEQPLRLLPDISFQYQEVAQFNPARARAIVEPMLEQRSLPSYRKFFGEALPWDVLTLDAASAEVSFERLAARVYGPLLAHRVRP